MFCFGGFDWVMREMDSGDIGVYGLSWFVRLLISFLLYFGRICYEFLWLWFWIYESWGRRFDLIWWVVNSELNSLDGNSDWKNSSGSSGFLVWILFWND